MLITCVCVRVAALPEAVKVFVGNVIQLLSFVTVIVIAFPYFLIAAAPVVVVFVFIARFYNRGNRQIRRLEGVVRSPVFSDLSTMLSGLRTIRAYGMGPMFLRRLYARADKFHSSVLMFWTLRCLLWFLLFLCYTYSRACGISRWLSLRLDMICNLMVFVASVIAVATRSTTFVANGGLAITYALRFGSFVQWTLR